MIEIFPHKSQYLIGEQIVLRINSDEKIKKIHIAIFSLYNKLFELNINRPFKTKDILVDTSEYKIGGYGVEANVDTNNDSFKIHTSFDICKNPNDSLRYGFISDFDKKDIKNGAIDWLRKCHINIVQFYDWSYRHDHLTSELSEYTDMMGKHINRNTIISKNKEANLYGMRGIAYGAVYAASKSYYESNKELGFYYPDGKSITFIDVFYLMNIERKSSWVAHLINQYYLAIKDMGFSGIHMDTYGFPKTAISKIGKDPIVHLDREFKYLINQTKSELKRRGVNPLLIFNNVGNWPVYATANSNVDAVYVEVWDPYDKYHHISSIIAQAKLTLNKPKPIILAAYLKPFRTESIESGMNAAKLLMAAIVSSGAYHLLIGENKSVLTQGYYSDYTRLDDKSAEEIKSYYDFMIRYFDLFYDNSLIDVSFSHFAGDNLEYSSSYKKLSVNPVANNVWAIIRENKKRKVINLINLCGNNDDCWNKGKNKPKTQKNIKFKVQIDKQISGVYIASPDYNNQKMICADFEIIENNRGRFISFVVDALTYWSVIDIEL